MLSNIVSRCNRLFNGLCAWHDLEESIDWLLALAVKSVLSRENIRVAFLKAKLAF